MDDEETADVVQIWRLSDLRLLHTLAVPVLPDHSGHDYPYDSRALADGRTAMLNTYYCGFYRLSALDTEHPQIELVHALREPGSEGCAVAVVVSHWWVVPVAFGRAVVNLDVADPSHPVEVSRLSTDSTFSPHWLSVDPGSDRIVICGTDDSEARCSSRIWIVPAAAFPGMSASEMQARRTGASTSIDRPGPTATLAAMSWHMLRCSAQSSNRPASTPRVLDALLPHPYERLHRAQSTQQATPVLAGRDYDRALQGCSGVSQHQSHPQAVCPREVPDAEHPNE
jgi:hypothetical protein